MIRIERSLLERELQAWTGREPKELIEFDQSQAFAMEKVATLTHAVRMLCDDLRDESSSLDHPLVRDRIASALASALLVRRSGTLSHWVTATCAAAIRTDRFASTSSIPNVRDEWPGWGRNRSS